MCIQCPLGTTALSASGQPKQRVKLSLGNYQGRDYHRGLEMIANHKGGRLCHQKPALCSHKEEAITHYLSPTVFWVLFVLDTFQKVG